MGTAGLMRSADVTWCQLFFAKTCLTFVDITSFIPTKCPNALTLLFSAGHSQTSQHVQKQELAVRPMLRRAIAARALDDRGRSTPFPGCNRAIPRFLVLRDRWVLGWLKQKKQGHAGAHADSVIPASAKESLH